MNQRPLTPKEQAKADGYNTIAIAADNLASVAESAADQNEPGTYSEIYYRETADLFRGWAQRFRAAAFCVGLDLHP